MALQVGYGHAGQWLHARPRRLSTLILTLTCSYTLGRRSFSHRSRRVWEAHPLGPMPVRGQEMMRMEASKCPKCGEEPNFLEHLEKWYCYECNSYVDESEIEVEEEAEEQAEDQVEEETVEVAEETIEEEAAEVVPETTVEEPVEEEVAAPAPVEEPKPAVEVRMCPHCGQPLKWIEKYQRDYCYSCKKYAPVRKNAEPKSEPKPEPKPEPKSAEKKAESAKVCPECSGEMKYIEKYKEWYCHACRKYPLHKPKPKAPAETPNGEPECPKCGGALRHIEKYQRHYCNACKEYAPKSVTASAVKTCPACKSELKYIKQYNEWYCYKCKKYPLRPSKPVLLI
jgi:ribosomal protein S27AE/uncharacterized protein YbaR (Trm112 family)